MNIYIYWQIHAVSSRSYHLRNNNIYRHFDIVSLGVDSKYMYIIIIFYEVIIYENYNYLIDNYSRRQQKSF